MVDNDTHQLSPHVEAFLKLSAVVAELRRNYGPVIAQAATIAAANIVIEAVPEQERGAVMQTTRSLLELYAAAGERPPLPQA